MDVNLDVYYDGSITNGKPQILINIKNDKYENFGLYYDLDDNVIHYSSLFKYNNKYQDEDEDLLYSLEEELEEIFYEDPGIFEALMLETYFDSFTLYGALVQKEITEESIDNILDFLSSDKEIEVVKHLKEKL